MQCMRLIKKKFVIFLLLLLFLMSNFRVFVVSRSCCLWQQNNRCGGLRGEMWAGDNELESSDISIDELPNWVPFPGEVFGSLV